MSLVVNQRGDVMFNLEHCSYLYVGDDNWVKAIMDGQKMIRMGTYADYDCACAALEEMTEQIQSNRPICRFASSEDMLNKVVRSRNPARDKFAGNGKKPVRRGGS